MADVTQTIDSDSAIQNETTQTINVNSVISVAKDFRFDLDFFIPSTEDFEHNVEVTQTVPVAPTLLTATDLLTGDKVRLVWSGGGPFYNVHFKKTADVTFIKANAEVLPGSQTQYDVGGLERDVSYDFQISSINGAGVETF